MPAKTEEDKVAPIILGLSAVGLIGLGLYFWTRKPPSVQPGAKMLATFKYMHKGISGNYYFRIQLGEIRPYLPPFPHFDEVEGLEWKIMEIIKSHIEWTPCTTEISFQIPEWIVPKRYDAEGSIRTLDDKLIIRHLQESAINIIV